jgi:hypothetical protein
MGHAEQGAEKCGAHALGEGYRPMSRIGMVSLNSPFARPDGILGCAGARQSVARFVAEASRRAGVFLGCAGTPVSRAAPKCTYLSRAESRC